MGFSSQTLTEQSRCRERAACTLISRCRSNTNDHRDSLKFVQEVARFVTRSKKALNLAKLATLCTSLLLTSLSVWLQKYTWRISKRTHTYRNIWTTANQRGGPPFTISDWFIPQYEPNDNEPNEPQSRRRFFFRRTAGRTGGTSDFC